MTTAIAQWGNSSAVRIPSAVLGESRFKMGDLIDVVVNARGNIELVEPEAGHRKLKAPGRTTSAELFARFPADAVPESGSAWPSDDMVGAEWESWSD